ncbi:aspartate carbamoyltransferase catalytic subunit [Carboxydothermus ferrireducens]|uniref:Aspartate carbamoyltransferase n=1 Tax=Carboxydothermus ferrireducens DSM 11255 TaxID=1119529 RepID=A0ABX2RDZ7_9THEO|nr:aspartate carbamoyltransferase catalytic subunit [Carboxydothermus ferrireducens]NYE58273.1 aspartate carbamoyltransferase catalytic subunit [Carboxydothermus ferrireducens DSM 11255]
MVKRKHLLGLQELSKEEINTILDIARPMRDIIMRDIKKVPTLRGKTVATLFYEPSTRTRSSFELAAKFLSADTLSINVSSSSVQKGESLIDTIRTLEAMGVEIIAVRHQQSGVPKFISLNTKMSVINAGDGFHEHPTQALLDLFTIKQKLYKIEGLKVAIIGDIYHSRVARSNIWGLIKLGAEVTVCGPPSLIPVEIEKLGVRVEINLQRTLEWADVVNVLRIQKERQDAGYLTTLDEYRDWYGLTQEKLEKLKGKKLLILHPGPMNRGVEIDDYVADSPNAVVNEQVTNGVAVRMAVLYLLAGGNESGNVD